jgi:hypothetical protein
VPVSLQYLPHIPNILGTICLGIGGAWAGASTPQPYNQQSAYFYVKLATVDMFLLKHHSFILVVFVVMLLLCLKSLMLFLR